MHRLTTKLLDTFPFTYYADARSIQRGRTYYRDGRVQEIIFSEDMHEATCQVDGELGEYTVELEVDQTSGELFFDCDCPYAEQHFCKHMIAAALAVGYSPE